MRIVSMYIARMRSHEYVEARDCMRSVYADGRTFPSFLGRRKEGERERSAGEREIERKRVKERQTRARSRWIAETHCL